MQVLKDCLKQLEVLKSRAKQAKREREENGEEDEEEDEVDGEEEEKEETDGEDVVQNLLDVAQVCGSIIIYTVSIVVSLYANDLLYCF